MPHKNLQSNYQDLNSDISRLKVWQFIIFVLLFYYLPIILVFVDILSFSHRFQILVIMTGIMVIYVAWQQRSIHSLGFRQDTIKQSLFFNCLLSLLFLLIMLGMYYTNSIRTPTAPSSPFFYPFYIFISSPCQEFLYRSAIFSEMEATNIKGAKQQVIISAITYCFLHIIYNDLITLSITFFMGVIWGIIYYKYPNLFGVILSHSVLGAISIAVGLI